MGSKGLRYAIRDGFTGLKRHPLIILVAITTMFIMLFLLGAFVIFAINANHLLQEAGEIPPVEVQFEVGTNPEGVINLANQFQDNENIVEYKVMSPEDNIEEFKDLIEKAELFDEFDYGKHIPWTILLRLKDPQLGPVFREEVINYPGVYDVMMETNLMQTLQKAIEGVSIISVVVFLVLLFISILVISNMVRMIALSRSNELLIMKTMGATDTYIRIPFVIQGVFLSMVSSLISIVVLLLNYRLLLSRESGFITGSLLPLSNVTLPVILIVFVFAILIGGLTSALSIRRYIQV